MRLTLGRQTASSSEKENKGRGCRIKKPSKYVVESSEADEETDDEEPKQKSSKKSSNESKSCVEQYYKQKNISVPSPPSLPPLSSSMKSKNKRCDSKSSDNNTNTSSRQVTEKSTERRSDTGHDKPSSSSTFDFMHLDENMASNLGTPLKEKFRSTSWFSPDKSTSTKNFSVTSAKINLFASPVKKRSAVNENELFSPAKSRKAKCKIAKKYKHCCGFLMKCEPSEAVMHALCSISCKCVLLFFRSFSNYYLFLTRYRAHLTEQLRRTCIKASKRS